MGCGNSAPVETKTNDSPAKNNAAAPADSNNNTNAAAAPAPAPAADGQPKNKNAKEARREQWPELSRKLPRTRSDADNDARDKLFSAWDPNGNGILSLAEIDKGCRELGLAELTDDLAPILLRAYTKARDVSTKKGDASDRPDFVNRSEFRLLLVYIYDYFELYVAFDEIDTSDDRRITINEFKKAAPRLESWGVPIKDAEAEFASIDKNGGGVILFDEFSEWAISKHLDVDGVENVQ